MPITFCHVNEETTYVIFSATQLSSHVLGSSQDLLFVIVQSLFTLCSFISKRKLLESNE